METPRSSETLFNSFRRYAVVIGIDDYAKAFGKLDNAARDARRVAEILKSEQRYKDENVILVLDDEAKWESLEEIFSTLKSTLKDRLLEDPPGGSRAPADDPTAVVVFFAGHGFAESSAGEPRGFLLPSDATASQENWLAMATLRRWLDELPCRHLLVILDCCFAGSFRWAPSRSALPRHSRLFESQATRFLSLPTWQVLTSSAHDEKAQDQAIFASDSRSGSTHSPFALALFEGLSGQADASGPTQRADGLITATELYQYIGSRLPELAGSKVQTAGLWPLRPESRGEFVFSNPTAAWATQDDPELAEDANPWLALATYGGSGRDIRQDRHLFFGRERPIGQLVQRLELSRTPGLIAIIGDSGTGKSSLARAGVIPRMVDLGWAVGLVEDPAHGLTDTRDFDPPSAASHGRKLLVIDQLERIFTGDATAGRAICRSIREQLAAGVWVLLTLRSEYESRLEGQDWLGELVPRGRFPMPSPTLADLREIIRGPATQRALFFESEALVDRLAEQTLGRTRALPFLSLTLSETFRRAIARRAHQEPDRMLREQDVPEGGVAGIVHRRATHLFEEADEETRQLLRKLILRMVDSEGGNRRGRRLDVDEIEAFDEPHKIRKAIEAWLSARLLNHDSEGRLGVAHEVLIVSWRLIDDWLEDGVDLSLRRSVWEAAAEWRSGHGGLWTFDRRLALLRAEDPHWNRVERRFIRQSRLRLSVLRLSIAAMTALVIVALSLFSLRSFHASVAAQLSELSAMQRTVEVERARRAAEDRALVASAAQALGEGDAPRAARRLLGVRALWETPTAPGLLQQTLQESYRPPVRLQDGVGIELVSFVFGDRFVVGARPGRDAQPLELFVWDPTDGRRVGGWTPSSSGDATLDDALRRLARVAFILEDDQPIHDEETAEDTRLLLGLNDAVMAAGAAKPQLAEIQELFLSVDGTLRAGRQAAQPFYILAADLHGESLALVGTKSIHWLDRSSFAPIREISWEDMPFQPWLLEEGFEGGEFATDGKSFVAFSSKHVMWISTATDEVKTWQANDNIQDLVVPVDERQGWVVVRLVDMFHQGTRLERVRSGVRLEAEPIAGPFPWSGRELAELGRYSVLTETDAGLEKIKFSQLEPDPVSLPLPFRPVAFAGDFEERRFVAAGADRAEVRLVPEPGLELARLPRQLARTAAFGPEGPVVLVTTSDHSVLHFLDRSEEAGEKTIPVSAKQASFSRDGQVLLTIGSDFRVESWDAVHGTRLAELHPASAELCTGRRRNCRADLSPSGHRAIVRSPEYRALHDATTGRIVSELELPEGGYDPGGPATFDSSGSHFTIYQALHSTEPRPADPPGGMLVIRDTDSGQIVDQIELERGVDPLFSPDGRQLAWSHSSPRRPTRCTLLSLDSWAEKEIGPVGCSPAAWVDASTLALLTQGDRYSLVDVDDGDEQLTIQLTSTPAHTLWTSRWLVAPQAGFLGIWSLRSGNREAQLSHFWTSDRCQLYASTSQDRILSICQQGFLEDEASTLLWVHPGVDPTALAARIATVWDICESSDVTDGVDAAICDRCRAGFEAELHGVPLVQSPRWSLAWRRFHRCLELSGDLSPDQGVIGNSAAKPRH